MKRFRVAFGIVTMFVVAGLLTGFAVAQSRSGTILGSVTDQSGAAIPGAKVLITNQGTNSQQAVTTDSSGRYEALLLPVGTYTVTVSAAGLKEAVVRNVVLETQQSRELNFALVPGTVQQTVTVDETAVQVERTDPTLGQVIHSQQVSELPLNGRDFVQLATLAPGVTQGETGFFTNQGQGEVAIRGSVSLSVQGMRENDNDWLLDGVDNNELTAGAVSILPSIDAIQEFKVLTFNYSAEYGSRGGGTILVTTKSGSNRLHGTAFEFLRNDELDARNYFDPPQKPIFIQNQFGATLGGPILKDKTFFFLSYQGERIRQGLTVLSTVPTALMRQGIFTESFPGFPAPTIYDPQSTQPDPVTGALSRTAFPNNTIPSNRLDPIGLALVNLFPLPNVPGTLSNDYLSNPIKTFGDDAGIARFDHNFSAK
ncbi:MAG TPA: carboxypeptidase regulatory-like domain-containing protein, partial [Chthoniobacterales bacterium]|nr:carboxypeptidase regulatory-like domain-containing protein [Chthoniobacterales bacterium]